MIHEIHIQKIQSNSENKKKCLALNILDEKDSSKREESSGSSSEESTEEEELVMLSKCIQRIMKMRKKWQEAYKEQ